MQNKEKLKNGGGKFEKKMAKLNDSESDVEIPDRDAEQRDAVKRSSKKEEKKLLSLLKNLQRTGKLQ